jgi:hypothetical protein
VGGALLLVVVLLRGVLGLGEGQRVVLLLLLLLEACRGSSKTQYDESQHDCRKAHAARQGIR